MKFLIIFCIYFLCLLTKTLELDLLTGLKKRNQFLLKHLNGIFSHYEFKRNLQYFKNYVSKSCFNEIEELLVTGNERFSAQFFDSWSNIPSGLLYGQHQSFGNFDECQSARMFSKKLNKLIKGHYTYLSVWTIRAQDIIETHLLAFGVCLPDSCSAIQIKDLFANNFKTTTKLVSLFRIQTEVGFSLDIPIEYAPLKHKEDISTSIYYTAKLGIFIFSCLGVLIFVSSLIDIIAIKLKETPHMILKSFSLFRNAKTLFGNSARKRGASCSYIHCVNGIRSLNLIWNIFGHAFMWSYSKSEFNAYDRIDWLKKLSSRALTSANVTVDTFLLLSGLLITWIGLHRLEHNGKIKIGLMYLHRLVRIMPAFAATILFASGLFIFLGDGPVWYNFILEHTDVCQQNWWKSLLFISNYANPEDMCMGHSWYLATDMQLYILAPFIIKGLWKWRSKIIWCLSVLVICSCYWTYSFIIKLQLEGFVFDGMIQGNNKFLPVAYSTHMRMGPWLIGVILGYSLYIKRNGEKKIGQLKILIGWLISLTLIILVVFGPQKLAAAAKEASSFEAAIYESLGRCAWAVAVAWIIFSCHLGYSETLNAFLSHSIWQLIARLNYSVYIVKTFVNFVDLGLQKNSSHFSNYEMVGLFWSDFGLSITFAVLLTLSVEIPFKKIEKYYLNKKRRYRIIV